MALAIEQTIGLASPSEVGEWVEAVAGDELHRRAQTIAEIEVASLQAPPSTDPKIGLAKQPVSEPHSQVSSISVSRPAISVVPPRKLNAAKLMVTVFALLALIGGGLGVIAMKDVLSAARHGEPNTMEPDAKRGFSMIGPLTVQAKAQKEVASPAPQNIWRPPPPPPPIKKQPPQQPEAPKPNAACDPPYTIDPATGRKKYKTECFK